MFDDNKLPQDERTQSLERDVKRHMADKVLLKYRIRCVLSRFFVMDLVDDFRTASLRPS